MLDFRYGISRNKWEAHMVGTEIPDVVFADNTSQRLPCVLVLDSSGSMEGARINELNAGLRVLEDELKKDDVASQRVQLLVIRFGGDNEVQVVTPWTDAISFSAPHLTANGLSPLGAAVRRPANCSRCGGHDSPRNW
jgi:Mg-chelatase subunit ChlD